MITRPVPALIRATGTCRLTTSRGGHGISVKICWRFRNLSDDTGVRISKLGETEDIPVAVMSGSPLPAPAAGNGKGPRGALCFRHGAPDSLHRHALALSVGDRLN